MAEKYHSGLRKDKVTPIFQHQISIALYLSTLHPTLMHPAEVYIVTFLHDTYEDADKIWKDNHINVIEELENSE